MIRIAPSILSADMSCLSREVKRAEQAGADLLHIDVMDGNFVPNITFGPAIVNAIRKETRLPLDIHLMVNHPESHIKSFIDAGGDIIIVHIEACSGNIISLIKEIRNYERKAGVAVKLNTSLSKIAHIFNCLDTVLLMSVNPGFAGQLFDRRIVPKIEALEKIRCEKGYSFDIEVDGGINSRTASLGVKAGATILVAGSAVFEQSDIEKAIKDLRKSLLNCGCDRK